MKAIYRGRKVDVWQVSRDNVQPDWVKYAFEHNGLQWLHGSGNKVRIYWPAVTRAKKGIILTREAEIPFKIVRIIPFFALVTAGQ